MTLLYYDPVFLQHDTGVHPESADRILPTARHLNLRSMGGPGVRPTWNPIEQKLLRRVHGGTYIKSVESFAGQGGGYIEQDTAVGQQSYDVALMAAGCVCDAVRRVVQAEDKHAFCLVRPPGHHALPGAAMGFCLFNNVALGARLAIDELGIDRVLIVDWDVHHGNGTQAIFWEDPQVGYFSIHRWPFYPGTGDTDERGGDQGIGATLNLPVEFGIARRDYLALFADELHQFNDRIKPELVLISAGFDSHRADPVGSLGLESEDFGSLTETVVEIANRHSGGRIVSVLEGGYNPQALRESIEVHLDAMDES